MKLSRQHWKSLWIPALGMAVACVSGCKHFEADALTVTLGKGVRTQPAHPCEGRGQVTLYRGETAIDTKEYVHRGDSLPSTPSCITSVVFRNFWGAGSFSVRVRNLELSCPAQVVRGRFNEVRVNEDTRTCQF